MLETPLRAGSSLRFKILRMLKSGESVTVLSTEADSGYSLVRVEGGLQGWILSRDLMDTPSARASLEQAQKAVEPLKAENNNLKQQLAALAEAKRSLEGDYQKISADSQHLNDSLAQIRKTSANAIAIDQRNKELEKQVVELERSLQLAQQENQALRDNSNQSWFLRGAGVLLLGALLGVVLPRMRSHKSNRWGDL